MKRIKFGWFNLAFLTLINSLTSVSATGRPVAPAPVITAVSPSSGLAAGGTSVTLHGTDFHQGATVTIDGKVCNVKSISSDSQSIVCITKAHPVGGPFSYHPHGQRRGDGHSSFSLHLFNEPAP